MKRKHGIIPTVLLSVTLMTAGCAAVLIPIRQDSLEIAEAGKEYDQLADEMLTFGKDARPSPEPDYMPDSALVSESEDTPYDLLHPPDGENDLDDGPDLSAATNPSEDDSDLNEGSTTPGTSSAGGQTGVDLAACQRKNADFIAWLRIPGTNINYPVVQSDDVDFYLNHSFTGQKSKLGTLFSLSKSDYETPGRNIAIYGHHITNTSNGQKMFRPLISFKQKSFWEKHQTVYLDSLYRSSQYRVFAVINMVSGDWDPSQAAFSSDEDFLSFIRNAQNHSLYSTGISVTASDHILTLITCDRSFASAKGRLVVMAVED